MRARRIRALARARRRAVPYWHDARPVLVVLAGLAALALGTIGYLDRHPEYGFFDAFYRSIALFGLDGAEDPPVPWTLEVARLLAPLVVGYAALLAVLSLFRQQIRLARVRLLARDHVVVAGLGEKGFRLATGLDAAGHRVVVVERDQANPRIAGVRDRGIAVLDGDATDPEVLRRAQVARARHLLAVCGDDGANVDVAAAAEDLCAGRRSGVLTALAHIDDPRLWLMLSSAGVGTERPAFRLEFFNVDALGAQALLDRHPPSAASGPPHVLIAGLDGVGAHLVLRVAAAWRGHAGRPRMTLAGPDAEAHAQRLRAEHPILDELCELRTQATLDPPAGPPPTVAYVCLAGEADALAAAFALRAGGRVVVAVPDEDSGVALVLRAEGRSLGGIEPFGVLTRALGPELLRHATTEVLARAKHDEYVRAEARRGLTTADNPSLRPWDDLPPALKDSNRRFADGISAKLAAARCVVVPAPLADPAEPGFAFTDAEVEELAIAEHDRWVSDLRRDGWRPTTGPKDPERRLHPLLVPWDALSEDDRDRDRDPVREIPAMLARAGFRVVRAGAPVSPGAPAARV